MIAGALLGTWLFTILSTDWLVLVLGFLLCVILLMDSFRAVERLTRHLDLRSQRLTSGFSFIGGTMGSVSGAGAFYFIVVYLKHACRSAESLRGTNVVLSMVMMIMRLIALLIAGRITTTLVTEGLLLAPVVFAATWLGTHFFRTSSPEQFFKWLQVLLFAGAGALVVKGIEQLS